MSIEAYQDLLRQTSRLRSIRIDATGAFELQATVLEGSSRLRVEVDPAFFSAASLCSRFAAATPRIPVPLPMNVASPMIDPARWGDFSDIRTNSVAKRQSIASGAWSGTIEEKFRWEFLGVALDYWNVLEIDFTVGPRQTSVEFKLDKSMSGGLAFEEGFLRLEEVSKLGVTGLTSKKTLCYGAGSKWCYLPTWALEKILLVWLTVTTTEYALRMVGSAGPGLTDAAADIAFAQLQAAQLDFYTQVYGVAR